jgi:hypothetical protein
MRVHWRNLGDDGTPNVGAFRDHCGGMSTDWNKYSSAQETLNRARVPGHNAIIEMNVEDVRSIPHQSVQHSPCPENRAHTNVIGDKRGDPEVRIKFQRNCRLVIPWLGQQE